MSAPANATVTHVDVSARQITVTVEHDTLTDTATALAVEQVGTEAAGERGEVVAQPWGLDVYPGSRPGRLVRVMTYRRVLR